MVRGSAFPALCSLCLAMVAAPSFSAEPTAAERETARALLKEGDWLFAGNKPQDALDRYRAAHAIMGLPTTGMAIVRCLIATGRLVEARDLAVQIARSATGPQDKPAFAAARTEAASTASSLEPRIPDLTITVSGAASPAVRVQLDGLPLPTAAVGHPWKLDPGKHVVEAHAPGMTPSRVEREVAEGDHATVELVLSPIPAAVEPPRGFDRSAPPPGAFGQVHPTRDDRAASLRTRKGPSRTAGYVVTGAGAASLAAGLAFGWKAMERKAYRDDHCDASGCDAAALDADDEGRTWATWSTVASGVGLAALGVGLYLIVSNPGSSAPATARVTPTPGGASLTVRW